jgi:hypothetical protein
VEAMRQRDCELEGKKTAGVAIDRFVGPLAGG